MKKGVKKQKDKCKCNLQCKLKKTLGVISAGAIGISLFMGYNRLTGNVISAVEGSTITSLGGIVLFMSGLVGIFLIVRE